LGLSSNTNDFLLYIYNFGSGAPIMHLFSFADSTSFLFTAGSGTATVNAVGPVATTPIPASLPLFASALGGLGFVGWRRRKASEAAV
jgi:hypothetical protein